jgi:chromosome segregation ATPase
VALLKELDIARSRNAWYASELELAKKAGYTPNQSSSPALDRAVPEQFTEADRPLIEALIAMRTELANVQGSVDQQAVHAAKKIAEVEKQRDAAVSEAIYAKAKLAAHGGSQSSTPQLDNESRDMGIMAAERSNDIGRKLAAALAVQTGLQSQISVFNSELEAEKRGRQLAEDTASAAQRRIVELESYKQQNGSEVERLKAELHNIQRESREQAIICQEAVATAQLLRVDKDDIEGRHKELLTTSKDHSETFDSLREAMAASGEMKALLERKLDEERSQREKVEDKLRRLRGEHEDRTAELEASQRKLKDAEEMAERHANEAKTHRMAVMSGLDKVTARSVSPSISSKDRTVALQSQIEAANNLVRKYQSAADSAHEKLRSAEERIAGLEAYQEQASREGLTIRKQLQVTMRETQSLQAANTELKNQLSNQQLETNAVNVQHNTLKDLLGERGISPGGAIARSRSINSPQNRTDTPDNARLKDLEQQLVAAHAAHEETKETYLTREKETESTYRQKLSLLENDYQSAVHYVKGTEKMLKRMKDELSRYKFENGKMKTELEEAESKATSSKEISGDWDVERGLLKSQIDTLQAELKSSHSLLEKQMQEVRAELQISHRERDQFKKSHQDAQQQLSSSMQQARSDLTQLQKENALLEQRAMDAEQKVSLLLDQVESSVDNYRRQSRLPAESHPAQGHTRNLSGADSTGGDSVYSNAAPGIDRNSMALDSLASELETLRTHWETTNKNYRLSTNFDFEKPAGSGLNNPSNTIEEEERELGLERPVEGTGGTKELSDSLADWRKRLDAEEEQAKSRKGSKDENGLGNGSREKTTGMI